MCGNGKFEPFFPFKSFSTFFFGVSVLVTFSYTFPFFRLCMSLLFSFWLLHLFLSPCLFTLFLASFFFSFLFCLLWFCCPMVEKLALYPFCLLFCLTMCNCLSFVFLLADLFPPSLWCFWLMRWVLLSFWAIPLWTLMCN